MAFIPLAMALGLVLGLLTGGNLRNLAGAEFRWWPLLVGSIGLQVLAELEVAASVGHLLVLLSYVALLVFAAANVAIRGMAIVFVGVALNALVIAVNGGMPVDADAIVAAGLAETEAEAASFDFGGKRHLRTENDCLVFLADVLPLPIGRQVLSYGDVVLMLGCAVVVYALMHGRRTRHTSNFLNGLHTSNKTTDNSYAGSSTHLDNRAVE